MNTTKKKLLFAVGYIFIALELLRIFGRFIQPAFPDAFAGGLAYQVLFTALAAVGAVLFGKAKAMKPQLAGFGAGVKTGLAIVVVYGLILAATLITDRKTFTASGVQIGMFCTQMLLVGVSEELMFRGLLQNLALDCTGEDTAAAARKGILLSGAFFGLLHLSNILAGVTVMGAAVQAVMAVPMGVILGIIYFRGKNNLLVPILIHGLVDTTTLMSSGGLSGVSTGDVISGLGTGIAQRALGFVMYTALALFLMRKTVMEKAIESRRAK